MHPNTDIQLYFKLLCSQADQHQQDIEPFPGRRNPRFLQLPAFSSTQKVGAMLEADVKCARSVVPLASMLTDASMRVLNHSCHVLSTCVEKM